MKKEKIHSFANRLTLRLILVMLLTMSATAAIVFLLTSRSIMVTMQQHYKDILEITNLKVGAMLDAVEISAENNVQEIQKHLETPESVTRTLASELGMNRHLTGAAVAFVPNYYPRKGTWFEPYADIDNGTVEVRQIGSARHNYLESEWFKEGLKAQKGYWSDPYFDDAGARKVLCTYSMPIQSSKGDTVGVYGGDISLEWLSAQMKMIDREDNELSMFRSARDSTNATYTFILGRGGEYIVHPDQSRILNRNFFEYADPADSLYRQLGERMLSGSRSNMDITIDGVRSFVFFGPVGDTGWSAAIVVPYYLVSMFGLVIGGIILFFFVIGLLFVFLFCYRSIRKAAKPLKILAKSADEVAKGRFDAPLPSIRKKNEIYLLRNSFEHMQHSLSDYIDKLTDTTARNAAMDNELSIARDIQMSMLPKIFPPYPERDDIDIYSMLTPAKAVGGDLYDFHIRNEHLFFCIGDVSGKGVPASLVMAVTSALFRTLSARETHPDVIVSEINASLSANNDSLMFVTLFVGVLDLVTGSLEYCNAGHDAPIVIGKEIRYLDVDSNMAVAILPEMKYSLQTTTLEMDETLFLYTDGLTEAENSTQELFGEARIFEALKRVDEHSPEAIIQHLVKAVHGFVAEAEQSDDLTMLAISRKKA